jgi:hypothetical protein
LLAVPVVERARAVSEQAPGQRGALGVDRLAVTQAAHEGLDVIGAVADRADLKRHACGEPAGREGLGGIERALERTCQPVALCARDELFSAQAQLSIACGLDASGNLFVEGAAV